MNQNIALLIALISITSYGQNLNKKSRFYFQNNEITKTEFETIDNRKTYTIRTTNDSLTSKTKYLHKNISKLDSIQLRQITMYLKKIIGFEFEQGKNTMIHLYRKNDINVYEDSKHKKYWNWIKKSKKYQSFLIGTKNSKIKMVNQNHIYIDQLNLIERLFFQTSHFEINHLLIKPTGEIYIYFGMNDILRVLDWSID
jgi:hypothetical protein